MVIFDLIDSDSEFVDSVMIHRWESVLHTDLVQNHLVTRSVTPYLGSKYSGNLYGLLHNELQIPNSAIYLNIRINGFKSSLDYNGELMLKILDPDVMLSLLDTLKY